MEGNIRFVGANVASLLGNLKAIVGEKTSPTPTMTIPSMTGSDRRKSEQMCGDRSCGEAAAPLYAHPTFTTSTARDSVAFNGPMISDRSRPGALPVPPTEHKVFSHGPATSQVTAKSAHHMAGRPTGKSVLPKMKMAPVK